MVLVRIGRYGPWPKSAHQTMKRSGSLRCSKGRRSKGITIEEALKLFELPRDLGTFEDKKVVAAIGRFRPLCAPRWQIREHSQGQRKHAL